MHIKKLYCMLLYTTTIHSLPLDNALEKLSKTLKNLTSLIQPTIDATVLEHNLLVEKKLVINDYPVYFINVLQQGPTDCQLHALKNALYSIPLLTQFPQNIGHNLDVLCDKKLYENLSNKWVNITETCSNVPTKKIYDLLKAIKSKTMEPKILSNAIDMLSIIDLKNDSTPINYTLPAIYDTLNKQRNAILHTSYSIQSFLVAFAYHDNNTINDYGYVKKIFGHAFAIAFYKNNTTQFFLVEDSWKGGSYYANQRNECIKDIIYALTMTDKNFYIWSATYFIENASIYIQKAREEKKYGYLLNALWSFQNSLEQYKKYGSIPQEKKEFICTLALNFKDRTLFKHEIAHDTGWNDDITAINNLLQECTLDCSL